MKKTVLCSSSDNKIKKRVKIKFVRIMIPLIIYCTTEIRLNPVIDQT